MTVPFIFIWLFSLYIEKIHFLEDLRSGLKKECSSLVIRIYSKGWETLKSRAVENPIFELVREGECWKLG